MTENMKSVQIHIPAEAEFIDVVRLSLYGIASQLGFSYEDIEDMKVAVSEACNNAIIHGYSLRQDGSVDITFYILKKGLQITVFDQGVSFNFNKKEGKIGPIADDHIQDAKVGELGIYLMQSLMDDVEIMSEEGMGTKVTLSKYLK